MKLKNKIINKNQKGFTLGEMVTTVAIIGTLSAVAVPNYLRIKMEVNMEMVRQELKKMQKNMNDIINQSRQIPQDISNLGTSIEESEVTASLSAIDAHDYTTDGYEVQPTRGMYRFTTCPKEKRLGISGDKCFALDSMGVIGFSVPRGTPWVGAGVPMMPFGLTQWDLGFNRDLLNAILGANSPLTEAERIALVASLMEKTAYGVDKTFNDPGKLVMYPSTDRSDKYSPSTLLFIPDDKRPAFQEYLIKAYDSLKEKGIKMQFTTRDVEESYRKFAKYPTTKTINYYKARFSEALEVGFKLDQPVMSSTELNTRIQDASDTFRSIVEKI
jgi:prepilin-type N-terminal cleavage/methylation domain-containing protein